MLRGAAAAAALCAAAGAAAKPHIVFILQDDLGHYDIGFHNPGAVNYTGNITALARAGIVLNNHYTHWHCSPTRRSFLTGRLPIHHHEQLSGLTTDDIDLRYTWVSKKLQGAGYKTYWFGKGHTGYKSMNHLPTRNGFDHFMGFLSGSQSYTSNDRWEDEHPVRDDAQFVDPPPGCGTGWGASGAEPGSPGAPGNCSTSWLPGKEIPSGTDARFFDLPDAAACCAQCGSDAACTHWVYAPNDSRGADHRCHTKSGASEVKDAPSADITSGIKAAAPTPPPTPPPPHACAASYSTTLYGEMCLQALGGHDAAVPFFLYFAIQAVHTPYDKVPGWGGETYEGMLWDSDVYIGAIVAKLEEKQMYANTLLIYSADNGGTGRGINYPLRGEKHTNWEGGMRVAAFVSGGLVPDALRGTDNSINFHIVDWYPTFCGLAGVDGTDDPPVPPGPVDPSDPTKSIYGDDSYPGVDGVDIWPMLTAPAGFNTSSAHQYLVLSKEVVVAGRHKLLVGQNSGWSHPDSGDNGWKDASGTWEKATVHLPCSSTDTGGGLHALPGIPGQLPCLFDLAADAGERTDIAPTNAALVEELWGVLNHTVLTAFCKGIDPKQVTGCNTSPAKLLGNCSSSCAQAYWKGLYGNAEGPVCGVPGC